MISAILGRFMCPKWTVHRRWLCAGSIRCRVGSDSRFILSLRAA
jgi:hypothetical protein